MASGVIDDDLSAPQRHGDSDVSAGMVDFAVNVRGTTPSWLLAALGERLADIARYPDAAQAHTATSAVCARHARPLGEVLLLAGAAEGFALLPALRPRRVALIQPTFTEPERVLRAAGIDICQVVLGEPWNRLSDAVVPDDVDMVVLGNPTNPTSVLHSRADIDALRRPGRTIVVDEAFADAMVGEPETLAGERLDDVIVIRSLTKTFALAGLRAGYLLAPEPIIGRLAESRPHWPLGTLQLAAIELCLGPRGREYAAREAEVVASERVSMLTALSDNGIEVVGNPVAPFVIVRVADGTTVKRRLAHRGIAVRSCANFTGLTPDHLRLAVRDAATVATLTGAWKDVT